MQSIPTSTFEIRDVKSRADFESYADLANISSPDKKTSGDEIIKHSSAFPSTSRRFRKLLSRKSEPVIGINIMEGYWTSTPDIWFANLVDNNASTSDIAEALILIEQIVKAEGAKTLQFWIADNRDNLVEALALQNFVEVQRNAQSELDLTTFDIKALQPAIDRFNKTGFKVVNTTELAELYPDDYLKMLWRADNEFFEDVPVTWEKKDIDYDTWFKEFEVDRIDWPRFLQVLDGDKLVATTMLFKSQVDPGRYLTGLTAVSRDYRRLGIAKAIKAIALQRAKDDGGTVVGTDNHLDNPMLQLNLQLGFKIVYHLVTFEKQF